MKLIPQDGQLIFEELGLEKGRNSLGDQPPEERPRNNLRISDFSNFDEDGASDMHLRKFAKPRSFYTTKGKAKVRERFSLQYADTVKVRGPEMKELKKFEPHLIGMVRSKSHEPKFKAKSGASKKSSRGSSKNSYDPMEGASNRHGSLERPIAKSGSKDGSPTSALSRSSPVVHQPRESSDPLENQYIGDSPINRVPRPMSFESYMKDQNGADEVHELRTIPEDGGYLPRRGRARSKSLLTKPIQPLPQLPAASHHGTVPRKRVSTKTNNNNEV